MLLITAGCFPPTPPAAAPADPNTITGIVWEWTSLTNQSTKETETIATPEKYTHTRNADGTLSGKATCYTFTGTDAQENGFKITLGATSMAYCGDASLDQKYLQLLGSVAAGGPDGQGNLALETPGGAERMLFKWWTSAEVIRIVWERRERHFPDDGLEPKRARAAGGLPPAASVGARISLRLRTRDAPDD